MAKNLSKILLVFLLLFGLKTVFAAQKVNTEVKPKQTKEDNSFVGVVEKVKPSIVYSNTQAQEGTSGLLVTPAKLDVVFIPPNEYKSGYISITNNTTASVPIKLSYGPIPIGEGGLYVFGEFNPTEFTLGAGQSQSVYYKIGGPLIALQDPQYLNASLKPVLEIITNKGSGVLDYIRVALNVKAVKAPADIIVSDLVLNPANPRENEPFSVSAVVKNIYHDLEGIPENSCKDTGPFKVTWFVNNTAVWSIQHTNLNAGTQSNSPAVTLKFPKGKAKGQYNIRFQADVDNAVSEFDETNNSFTKSINITGVSLIKYLPGGKVTTPLIKKKTLPTMNR